MELTAERRVTAQQFVTLYFAASIIALVAGFFLPIFAPQRVTPFAHSLDLAPNIIALGFTIALVVTVTAALNGRLPWPWLIVAAVLGRLALTITMWDQPQAISGDAAAYREIARSFANGHGLVLQGSGVSTFAVFPPAYSIALSGPMMIGFSDRAATAIINAICDLAAALAIRGIAKESGNRRKGDIAAAVFLIWPSSITGFTISSKEALAIALALGLFCFLLIARRKINLVVATGAGFCGATLALTQPAWISVVGAAGIAFLITQPFSRTLKLAILSLPISLAIFTPWWIRNYLLFERFVPLTTAHGLNMYFVTTNSYSMSSELLLRAGHDEVAATNLGWKLSLDIIKNNPFEYLRNQVVTFIYALSLRGWQATVLAVDGGSSLLSAAIYRISQFAAISLNIMALVSSRNNKLNVTILSIGVITLIAIIVFNVWFELGERHLMLLPPILILLVATSGLAQSRDKAGDG